MEETIKCEKAVKMVKKLNIYIYIYIYKDGCCKSKERIRIDFKIGRSTKRFVFFEFIFYFVLK